MGFEQLPALLDELLDASCGDALITFGLSSLARYFLSEERRE
ncbi:MAG TPA: hypothetical protein VF101_09250 [Gaiellaceae bacterium]